MAKPKQTFSEYKALQARLSLAPISLPESLNDYFADVIPHMGNVLNFMRRYIGQDEHIKKIIETYDCLPPRMRRDLERVDLDYLAHKAKVEPIIVRERILVALSRYSESKFKLSITIYSDEIVKEIIAVALDSAHPDSQANKELIAQYLGIKALPKSAQINIQTNINEDNRSINLSNSLPSMNETLSPIEQILKGYQEQKQLNEANQFLDIDEVEKVDEEVIRELVEGEDFETEEDLENEDEDED